jgi:ribosomal protein L9
MSNYQEIFINKKGKWIKEKMKRGFAVHLLRNKEALPYNQENIQRISRLSLKAKNQKALEKEEVQKICEQINNLELIFKLSKKNEKVFGSIRVEEIIKELSKKSINLEKGQFLPFSPLSNLGEHLVEIKFGEWDNQIIKVKLKVNILEKLDEA